MSAAGVVNLEVRAARARRLAELIAAEGLDALVVGGLVRPGDSAESELVNLRWLTGFTGTSGACVIGPDPPLFITDFRYHERAERELSGAFDVARAEGAFMKALGERLSGRTGYDDANTSVRALRRLEEEVGEGVELVPAEGLVERLRRHKDGSELEAIAAAARLADATYEWLIERGIVGSAEREVARAAEARIRELGGEPAFPVIVAAGENGALPHSEPSEREIGAGELVVVDMGAKLDGYCSDCTRTFATGPLPDEEAEVYELVRRAQQAALDAIGPGVSGPDVDAAAREPIAAAGHGEHFGHGTGHGVGMEVHEAPRLAKGADDVLEPGDVVTVEPGVYLPTRFGVRIEDLVAITKDGHRNLSGLPKDLRIVG